MTVSDADYLLVSVVRQSHWPRTLSGHLGRGNRCGVTLTLSSGIAYAKGLQWLSASRECYGGYPIHAYV